MRRILCSDWLPERARYICYSPAGRAVLGKTVPEVSTTARGRRPRAVLETEGTVFNWKSYVFILDIRAIYTGENKTRLS